MLQRVGLAALGVLLVVGGFFGLVLGGCHSGGGFCAAEFQNDHAGALAGGLLGVVGGAAALAWAVVRHKAAVVAAIVLAVAVGGVAVVRSLP